MTTMMMNTSATFFKTPRTQAVRAPRLSFAARLAALQARHEAMEPVSGVAGVAIRAGLAAVPFTALALMFIAA